MGERERKTKEEVEQNAGSPETGKENIEESIEECKGNIKSLLEALTKETARLEKYEEIIENTENNLSREKREYEEVLEGIKEIIEKIKDSREKLTKHKQRFEQAQCIACGLWEDEAEEIGESIDEHDFELLCDDCFKEREARGFKREPDDEKTDEEKEMEAVIHRAKRHYGDDYKKFLRSKGYFL